MNEALTAFLDIVKKELDLLGHMQALEQNKRTALLDYDTKKIESALQEQQALIMKLDGIERRRVAAQNAAGFAGLTSSQILERLDRDDHAVLAPLLADLQHAAIGLQELNAVSLDIAAAGMRMMEQFAASDRTRELYQADGTQRSSSQAGASFEEKI